MYLVLSYNVQEGKEEELKKWLKEIGEPYWNKTAEVKSVRSYFRQFGLGQRPVFQTWLEIQSFSSLSFLDKWRTDSERQRIFQELFALTRDFNSSIVREL